MQSNINVYSAQNQEQYGYFGYFSSREQKKVLSNQ